MIGNDVVDLTDAETQAGARHPRFDARVFTAAERRAIAAGDRSERLRWRLWAAKEAAFKAARKADAATVFSPARFEVDLEAGVVRFDGECFGIRVDETEEYVHVVAEAWPCVGAGETRVAVGETSGRGGPGTARPTSAAARGLAIGVLAHDLDVHAGELRIVSLGRVPHVERDGEMLSVDLSLSHHGRFVACAFRAVGRAVPGPPRWRRAPGLAEAV